MFLVIGCKNDNPTAAAPLVLTGNIKLYDNVGNVEKNMSGIKVTIIENQQAQYTDSLGDYTFKDVPSGTYSFKFEYMDYPVMYIKNYSVRYDNGFTKIKNPIIYYDVFGISPRAAITYHLDSLSYQNIRYYDLFADKYTDSMSYAYNIRCVSMKSHEGNSWIYIMAKKYSELSYAKDNYYIIDYGSNTLYMDTLSYTGWHFTYKRIENYGFQAGDSLYVQFIPVTSLSYYIEGEKKIFPSIGTGSKIVGTIVR